MSCSAVFIALAAGSARRFAEDAANDAPNKVFVDLLGRPILAFSLEAAALTPGVQRIVVVARQDETAAAEAIARRVAGNLPVQALPGGETRQASELVALSWLADDIEGGAVDIVAIHDAARPFLTAPLLEAVLTTAGQTGGAIPGVAPTDAIWDAAMAATEPLDKASYRAVQTPQAFAARPLLDAYRAAAADDFSGADTAATVRRYSELAVTIVNGDDRNIKLTFADDIDRARLLATKWRATGWVG